jgi:very-short-patch-repair endonuclease
MVVHARNLRANLTDVEKKLWYHLRRKNIQGVKFRRQAPIGRYIADFACYEPKLIIELDGSQHTIQHAYDSKRDHWFEMQGFLVLRFWNHDVSDNIDGVLEKIWRVVERLQYAPLPGPPPQGGRE